MSGSLSSSTMSLSISVSAPVTTRFTSLSCSREICRTTRASLSKTCPSGTMRTSRMPLCICARWRSKRAMQARSSIAELARAERAAARALGEARDRGLDDRELADDGHQAVELADVDADRLADRAERHAPAPGRLPARGRAGDRTSGAIECMLGAGRSVGLAAGAGSPASPGASAHRGAAARTTSWLGTGVAADAGLEALGAAARWTSSIDDVRAR